MTFYLLCAPNLFYNAVVVDRFSKYALKFECFFKDLNNGLKIGPGVAFPCHMFVKTSQQKSKKNSINLTLIFKKNLLFFQIIP